MATQEKSTVQRLIDWAQGNPTPDQAFTRLNKLGVFVEHTLNQLRESYDDYLPILSEFWEVIDALSCGKSQRNAAMANLKKLEDANHKFNQIALSEKHSALQIARIWSTHPNEFLSLLVDIAANGINEPIKVFKGDIKDGMTRAVCGLLSGHIAPIENKKSWTIADSYSSILRRNMTDSQRLAAFIDFRLFDGRKIQESAVRAGFSESAMKHISSLRNSVSKELWANTVALWRNNELAVTTPYKTFLAHDAASKIGATLNVPVQELSIDHIAKRVVKVNKYLENIENIGRIAYDYFNSGCDQDAVHQAIFDYASEYENAYNEFLHMTQDVEDVQELEDVQDVQDTDQTTEVIDVDVPAMVTYLIEQRSNEFFTELLKQGYYVTEKEKVDSDV